jgi:hypothetical protein
MLGSTIEVSSNGSPQKVICFTNDIRSAGFFFTSTFRTCHEAVTNCSFFHINICCWCAGLSEQIRELREVIELPLLNPELFKRVGITPPKVNFVRVRQIFEVFGVQM